MIVTSAVNHARPLSAIGVLMKNIKKAQAISNVQIDPISAKDQRFILIWYIPPIIDRMPVIISIGPMIRCQSSLRLNLYIVINITAKGPKITPKAP
jgi:hypothetical protein